MLPWQSSFRDVEGNIEEFDDNNMESTDDQPYHKEHFVLKEVIKNVDFIINLSTIDHVEDLEDHKDVENVSHMSARSIYFNLVLIQWSVIPIVESSWI